MLPIYLVVRYTVKRVALSHGFVPHPPALAHPAPTFRPSIVFERVSLLCLQN